MTETYKEASMLGILTQKKCTKCKAWKSKSEFRKHASSKDGLHSWCKQCNNEYNRKWNDTNKEYHREYQRKWNEANPDKMRSHNQAHLARKAGNGGSFTDKEWQDLCERYDYRCLCCGEQKKLTADHVIPVAKGGTSYIDNIQCLCRSCNSKKHTKEIDYRW
jgi:hypothetical protein